MKERFSEVIAQHVLEEDWGAIERYFQETAFMKHLGITVDLRVPDGPRCDIREVQPFHLGGVGQGFVNGAVISALFDLVIGLNGLRYTSRGNFATTQVHVQFLKPVEGPRVHAVSQRTTELGNRVFCEATLFDGRNMPCAHATGEIRVGIR